MEANGILGRLGARGQGSSGRRNSILIAGVSAVAAAALIFVFVSHFRKTTVLAPATTTVYVARGYIPAGTTEAQILSGGLIKTKTVPVAQVNPGAVTIPSTLTGDVTATAIAAGQQITVAEFARGSGALNTQLTGTKRAVAIAIDSAHGLTAYIGPGDDVDIYTQGKAGTALLFQNVPVLENANGNVVLELNDRDVLLLGDAYQENLTVWLALRPATKATASIKVGTVEKLP